MHIAPLMFVFPLGSDKLNCSCVVVHMDFMHHLNGDGNSDIIIEILDALGQLFDF
jgi:hypothetical protein